MTGLPKVSSAAGLTDAPGHCHPEPWVQKYRDRPGGKERPTFSIATSKTVQIRGEDMQWQLGFTESKKQQVSMRRKRTGCPKDKIQPLVSPLVVNCQGLGKFSSMLGR